MLTEYEVGRAQMAIEWVARSQKPIVEIGGRPEKGCDFHALAHDLNQCIAKSGESVRGFVIPDRVPGYCCYGFYRYPWAVQALLAIWGKNKSGLTRSKDWLWIQGLVFGYSPDAIQQFISSASGALASIQRWSQRSDVAHYRRVEIYGTPARLFRRRSSLNGKSRRPD